MREEEELQESPIDSISQLDKKYQHNNVVQKHVPEDDVEKRLSCYFANVIKMPSRIGCKAYKFSFLNYNNV